MRTGHGLQIGARAERAAGAGQDANPDTWIAVDLVPGLAHQGHHRTGERVACRWAVHRHDQDVPPPLNQRVRLGGTVRRRLLCRAFLGRPSAAVGGRGSGSGRGGHGGDISSLGHGRGLPKTITRSTFFPMALNFADLFEHAADVFAERIAVACGERQVTYRELEERANRLAHHLAAIGVQPGDHVGLYARNSIEAAETLIASCKLRAAAVNINYRYVENELRYMFADADLAALVYDREFAPR